MEKDKEEGSLEKLVVKPKTIEDLAQEYQQIYADILKDTAKYIKECSANGRSNCDRVVYAAIYYTTHKDELIKKLKELANYSGCLSCAYSKPCDVNPMPECRFCELGLNQTWCKHYKRIQSNNGEQ
ncbi:hypothetical protein [Thermofilum sp.]|uniref:hypothetical protein n=1 Tax=Thermofilum sp. TaxID=1961369 RepID=UPI0025842FD2|nr:hypothetical protein [Thermofilum sp.]